MNEKMHLSAPSNRAIIKKFKKEGMPDIKSIENILFFQRADKLKNKFNKINKNKNKENKTDNDNNINYTEAIRFIYKFNNQMTRSFEDYKSQQKENIYFKNSYKNYKDKEKKMPFIEHEKIIYAFGNLLKRYNDKGLKITRKSFDKDLYKECGLLHQDSNSLNKFYKYNYSSSDINIKNKKSRKNIDFLVKIKKQIRGVYNKRILEGKKLQDNYENIKFFGDNKPKSEEFIYKTKIKESKLKRHDAITFFHDVNFMYKEIDDEKKEINRLKKLILNQEKENILKKRIYNEDNKIVKIEDNSYFPIHKRNKLKIINPIMSTKFINNSASSILSNIEEEKIHINDKKKLISEESKIFSTIENQNIKSNNNSQINLTKSDSTNITQNNLIDINNFSLGNVMRRRLSSNPYFNKKRDSNTMRSITINLKRQRRATIFDTKIFKKSSTVDDIYEKISNLDFISYKQNTIAKKDKVNNLLKKYYGKKYQNYNKKNNHIKILDNYIRMKDDIIKSENKNSIIKYKDDLPKLIRNKVETSIEQNEKLKNVPEIFIKSFFKKKIEKII